MEPIINPWLIYLIMQVDSWTNLLGAISLIVIVIGTILYSISIFANPKVPGSEWEPEGINKIKKLRHILWVGILFLVIISITPNQKTIIAMYAAKNLTPVNIEKAQTAGKDAVSYLLDEIFKRTNRHQEPQSSGHDELLEKED